MVKREFKALMADDFKERWLRYAASQEGASVEDAQNWYGGKDLDAFSDRVSGRVVTIVECEYKEGSNDYFEKEDNNFVLDPCLFVEVE
jgi:hypothetical protein